MPAARRASKRAKASKIDDATSEPSRLAQATREFLERDKKLVEQSKRRLAAAKKRRARPSSRKA